MHFIHFIQTLTLPFDQLPFFMRLADACFVAMVFFFALSLYQKLSFSSIWHMQVAESFMFATLGTTFHVWVKLLYSLAPDSLLLFWCSEGIRFLSALTLISLLSLSVLFAWRRKEDWKGVINYNNGSTFCMAVYNFGAFFSLSYGISSWRFS